MNVFCFKRMSNYAIVTKIYVNARATTSVIVGFVFWYLCFVAMNDTFKLSETERKQYVELC